MWNHPLIRLIQQCLHNGPHKRPSIRECCVCWRRPSWSQGQRVGKVQRCSDPAQEPGGGLGNTCHNNRVLIVNS
ncbi:hypothetical protein GBAR_LOCUS17917 [Geodia barretti]|uniref:Uncharacterized protein n=1 Tax=Geodia barretti TaxID=519541 RepID=A0AA35SMY2_GEOBA|nr:hypothetical protein GBAR_LOCUS17917 [Geodia barretti]